MNPHELGKVVSGEDLPAIFEGILDTDLGRFKRGFTRRKKNPYSGSFGMGNEPSLPCRPRSPWLVMEYSACTLGMIKESHDIWVDEGSPSKLALGGEHFLNRRVICPESEIDGRARRYSLTVLVFCGGRFKKNGLCVSALPRQVQAQFDEVFGLALGDTVQHFAQFMEAPRQSAKPKRPSLTPTMRAEAPTGTKGSADIRKSFRRAAYATSARMASSPAAATTPGADANSANFSDVVRVAHERFG